MLFDEEKTISAVLGADGAHRFEVSFAPRVVETAKAIELSLQNAEVIKKLHAVCGYKTTMVDLVELACKLVQSSEQRLDSQDKVLSLEKNYSLDQQDQNRHLECYSDPDETGKPTFDCSLRLSNSEDGRFCLRIEPSDKNRSVLEPILVGSNIRPDHMVLSFGKDPTGKADVQFWVNY